MVEITSRAADSFCAAYFFLENATPQEVRWKLRLTARCENNFRGCCVLFAEQLVAP